MDQLSSVAASDVQEPGFLRGLRAFDKGLAKVEELVLSFLLVVLILLAVYQAYKRNVSPPSPYWPDEVIRYSVFSIGLLGAALASQSRRLMNIDLLVHLFSKKGRVVLRVLGTLFTLVVCYLIVKGSLHVREVNIRLGEHGEVITPGTGIMILPVSAILIGLHMTIHAIIDVYYLSIGKLPPDADAAPVAH